MLKVAFVCFILIFQVATVENIGNPYQDLMNEDPAGKYFGKGSSANEDPAGKDFGRGSSANEDPAGKDFGKGSSANEDPAGKDFGRGSSANEDPAGKDFGRGSSARQTNYYQSCRRCGMAYGDGMGGGRVINGKPVRPIYKYPWIASIIKGSKIVCGGALISANFVMTAGHCVFNERKLSLPQCRGRTISRNCLVSPRELKAGFLTSSQRTPSESVAVARIIPHPKYSFSLQVHDVSLLRLAKPVQCNRYVMPVCLPQRDYLNLGSRLITAGYGWNTPEGIRGPQILREGEVSAIDPRRCAKQNQPAEAVGSLVCAAGMQSGQSSCYGDSGSSLISRMGSKYYSVGVVSYGSSPRCSNMNPVAYTRVANHMPFIRRVVRDLPQS